MRPTQFERAKLDRAIIVLVHQLMGMERTNRYPLAAANRDRLNDDAEAISHLLKFAEYAIHQLAIRERHEPAGMDEPAKTQNRLHVRPAVPAGHSRASTGAVKSGKLSLFRYVRGMRGCRRRAGPVEARDCLH